MKTKIKRDDMVKVIAGKDKGKTGRVIKVDRDKGRVIVQGLNMVRKAVKPKNQNDKGGIIDVEASLHLSNVMLVDKKGNGTRVGFEMKGDKKVRVAKTTGEQI